MRERAERLGGELDVWSEQERVLKLSFDPRFYCLHSFFLTKQFPTILETEENDDGQSA